MKEVKKCMFVGGKACHVTLFPILRYTIGLFDAYLFVTNCDFRCLCQTLLIA